MIPSDLAARAARRARSLASWDAGDLLVFAVPLLAAFPLRNNDLWWHLATGRWMVAEGGVPRRDPFSFTGFMGSWIDNEWLAQLALYAAWLVGGNAGLVLARAAVVAAVFLLVRALLARAGRAELFAPAVFCGVALSYGWWGTRPSMFSLLGVLVLLLLLDRLRSGRGAVAGLPLLFLAWANVHPGFFFGLAVLAAMLAAVAVEPLIPRWPRWGLRAGARRDLALATVLSVAATLVNPYGWHVFAQQLVIARGREYRALLDEWAPPSPWFIALVLASSTAFLALRFRKVPLASLAPLLGAAALATTAVRFEEYFALVTIPLMLAGLGPTRGSRRPAVFVALLVAAALVCGLLPPAASVLQEGSGLADGAVLPADAALHARVRVGVGVAALVLGASVLASARRRRGRSPRLLASWRGRSAPAAACAGLGLSVAILVVAPVVRAAPEDLVEPGRYPAACLDVLPGPEERVMNRLSWGGWMLWKSGTPTYVDGRSWGQPIFFEYHACDGPRCDAVLARRGIDWAIFGPSDPPARHLAESPAWRAVCRDEAAVVFRRSDRPGPAGAPPVLSGDLGIASRR